MAPACTFHRPGAQFGIKKEPESGACWKGAAAHFCKEIPISTESPGTAGIARLSHCQGSCMAFCFHEKNTGKMLFANEAKHQSPLLFPAFPKVLSQQTHLFVPSLVWSIIRLPCSMISMSHYCLSLTERCVTNIWPHNHTPQTQPGSTTDNTKLH